MNSIIFYSLSAVHSLDGCPESNNGVFHVAELIDRIWITSTGGEEFRAGENVTIAVGTYMSRKIREII